MGIQIIEDQEQWDSFILKSPFGHIFHLFDFLKIVERHTRFQLFPYGITQGEKLVAVIPLFYQKRYGLRFILSPPPKTAIPHLGIVLDGSINTLNQTKKEHLLHQISDELISEIDSFSTNLVYISNPPDEIDFRNFLWRGYDLKPGYTYYLDLNPSIDEILGGFTRQRRQSIKKAEQQGFEVRTGGDLSVLFHDLERRYREQGLSLPLTSKEYLADLHSTFPDHFKLYTVEKEGTIEGLILTTRYKDVKLWVGAGSVELLIWNIIRDAKRDGFPYCEFVGANTGNLCKFKNQFNPSLKVYYEIYNRDTIGKISEYFYVHLMKKDYLS